MPPIQLIATKRLTYGTRRLSADDIFTARTGTDARALIATKQAKPYVADKKKIVPVDPRKATTDDTHKLVTAKPAPKPAPEKAPAKRAAKKSKSA